MWLLLLLLKNINGKYFLIQTAEDIKVNQSDYMLQGPGNDIDDNSLDDTTPTVGCIGKWNGFRDISCFRPGYDKTLLEREETCFCLDKDQIQTVSKIVIQT